MPTTQTSTTTALLVIKDASGVLELWNSTRKVFYDEGPWSHEFAREIGIASLPDRHILYWLGEVEDTADAETGDIISTTYTVTVTRLATASDLRNTQLL